ncbi:putative transposase [Salinibacter ruber]|jgi:putative transposase|nr:putative transposase [Salinibacter ruber]
MSKYRRGAHTIYEIKYHLVWVTKYRYRVLTGEVAHRARELVRQACLSLDVRIETGHVSKDHTRVGIESSDP